MYETHVTVQGRLVADPVVKRSRDGAPFTTFRVAQSERRPARGEPGQWTESEPSYYDVSVFRGPGANAARSLRRGHPVVVHGKQRVRAFQRPDGSYGARTEIEAYALGHDLRWGCTAFTRNGDLEPSVPAGDAAGGPVGGGDPEHDAYVVEEGEARSNGSSADAGPLVRPDGEPSAA